SREPIRQAGQEAMPNLKHDFAVEPIESSFGGPREFLSYCVRCKWTFRINPDRGSIVAYDHNGAALDEPEASHRVNTFAEGPCPALDDSDTEPLPRADAHPGFLERLSPVLHALGFDRIH
ncbi:MAG TPA: hypothetical protein VN867_15245, partial [Candidatus Binataceae bacterium]|nr:hypothetical protein [Candidatus Binataceae bacterium]